MSTRETKTLSFTPQQAMFVRECVESGQYQSASEVVRAGLRLLADQEKSKAWIRAEIQKGLDDLDAGRTVPADEVLTELRAKHERLRREADEAARRDSA